MDEQLIKILESLPPLTKTVIELERFQKSTNKNLEELLAILEQDPLAIASLLKVANSSMFGFNDKVVTASKALHLLGVNFTLSIVFGTAMKNAFPYDLKAYGMEVDGFLKVANIASNLLSLWYGRIDNSLKESLLLPVFLLETGRFILSGIAKERDISEKFYEEIVQNPFEISKIENFYFQTTSAEVTATIFRHWNLSEELSNIIE